MADEELAAIRAKRMEELQTQYGVCFFDILVFVQIFCLINTFVKIQGQNAAQMQQQQEAMKRFVDGVDYSIIVQVKKFKSDLIFLTFFNRSVVIGIYL